MEAAAPVASREAPPLRLVDPLDQLVDLRGVEQPEAADVAVRADVDHPDAVVGVEHGDRVGRRISHQRRSGVAVPV